MLKASHFRLGIVIIGGLALVLAPLQYEKSVRADAGECSASLVPAQIVPAENTELNLTVANNGSPDVRWVQIVLPAAAQYAGNSITGWATADQSDGVIAYSGTISSGDSTLFRIQAYGMLEPTQQEVTVRVSDDENGTNPVTCQGSLTLQVQGHPDFNAASGMSDVRVEGITANSAVVRWTSDVPTGSIVYFGQNDSYGRSSTYSADQTTDHSVVISGLSPSVTYHFQVAGTDGYGTFLFSNDNTFVTAEAPRNPSSQQNGGAQQPNATPVLLRPVAKQESVPPQIRLNTVLSGAYVAAPVIEGEASDNAGILQVEYSTDGGKNWSILPGSGGTGTVAFRFTPTVNEDGDYAVSVRAVDTSGNTTQSPVQRLVIDRLPPLVGGVLLQSGTQTILPAQTNTYDSVEGVDQDIIVNAVGGATKMAIFAKREGGKGGTQSFSMTRSEETGLWLGALNFRSAGNYRLTIWSQDGAGNETVRNLFSVSVRARGMIRDAKTSTPITAFVEVFVRDQETNEWSLWDGGTYNQSNPVVSQGEAGFSLYLPSGEYYVRAYSHGYKSVLSERFRLVSPQPISFSLEMQRVVSVGSEQLGWSAPVWEVRKLVAPVSPRPVRDLEKAPIPDFQLSRTDGSQLVVADIFGRPTVLSFVSTWSPLAQDQLATLSQLANDKDMAEVNIIAVFVGENPAKVRAFQKIGGYSMTMVADPTGELARQLAISSSPTTVLIDRYGMMRQQYQSILSSAELKDNIIQQGN